MTIQYTFSIVKPDATKRNLIGNIISKLEEGGLKIVAQKMTRLTEDQAKGFYSEHSERPFFNDLVNFMTSGPLVLQVLKGENAIIRNREIMGATNPAEAAEGTIRKLYAENIEANSIHGSDSEESAEREITYFFAKEDIVE
jgi:nucleoside-diphosphate kinase